MRSAVKPLLCLFAGLMLAMPAADAAITDEFGVGYNWIVQTMADN